MVLMGPLPIDFQTLWTSEKCLLLKKDKVWDFPFCLFPCDFIKENVTEEAPGKKGLLIQGDDFFLNEFL